jgi:hypothetical protein
MRLAIRLLLVAGLAALVLPGRAAASTETVVLETTPITVTAYEVARGVRLAPSPKVDGYVVGMSAEVVDVLGNPVPMQDVMLDHVVFAKVDVPVSAPRPARAGAAAHDGLRRPGGQARARR